MPPVTYGTTEPRRGRHDQVAAVVEQVRRLDVRVCRDEVQALRDAQRAADLALDADVAIEVDRRRCRRGRSCRSSDPACLALGEERAAAGNDGDFDGPGPGADSCVCA